MLFPLKDENPLHRIPFQYVTVVVMAACVLVYLVQYLGGHQTNGEMIYGLGMIPVTLFGAGQLPPELYIVPPWLTLITSTFLHGGFLHLAGNMLYLWIFGDNVEDALGHVRFVVFYVICGVAAGLLHAAFDPSSEIPTIGASGAISGVLGAYLMLHPRRGVWILFFFRPMRFPTWAVLGFWIGFQFLNAGFGSEESSTAWWAHIGGFIAGAVLIIFMRPNGVPLFERIPEGPWSKVRRRNRSNR
jgi:membrane associated rhomboid family serine protease